jgi:hypothetical protein
MRELETTVSHLRHLYQEEVESVRTENTKLKGILDAHGIHYDVSASTPAGYTSSGSSGFGGSPTFGSQSQSTGYTSVSPQPLNLHLAQPSSNFSQQLPPLSTSGSMHPSQRSIVQNMDYNEIGLEFVGTYGRTPYLSPPPAQ